VVVLPDEDMGVVADYCNGTIVFVSLSAPVQVIDWIALDPAQMSYAQDIVLVQGGDYAVVGHPNAAVVASVRVRNGPRAIIEYLPIAVESRNLAATPDGTRVLVVGNGSTTVPANVTIVSVDENGLLAPGNVVTLDEMRAPSDAVVTSDGERLVIARSSTNAATQMSIVAINGMTLDTAPDPIGGDIAIEAYDLAISADGTRIYVAGSYGAEAITYLDVDVINDSITDSGVDVWGAGGPGPEHGARGIQVTADGTRAFVLGGTYGLMVLDLTVGPPQWLPFDDALTDPHCPRILIVPDPECPATDWFDATMGRTLAIELSP
jgi:hypothetical protein